jgi:tetratricopeptide (TPR) repeat protein
MDSADYEYSQKNYTKSIEIVTQVKILAETNNWDDFNWNALNLMGICYRMISDYDKSLDCFLESYKIVLKTSDRQGELVLLANIAQAYSQGENHIQAIENLQKALAIAKDLKDTIRIGILYVNLCWVANAMEDLKLARKYIDTGLVFLEVKASKEWIFLAKTIKLENLYLSKAYPAAEKLVIDVLDEHGDEINKFHTIVSFLLLSSKIYQHLGNQQNALYFLSEALKYNPSLKNRIEIYDQFSSIYWESDSFYLAGLYKDSVILLKDSLHKIFTRDNLENNRIRFELLNSEKELSESKAKQKAERTLFIFILIFVIALAIILIWVFRMRSIKNKQRKIILENEQKITKLELEKERNKKLLLKKQLKEQETLALLEQEKLNNEIEAKNRQLTAKILSQSNRHEWIEEMLKELSEISGHSENDLLDPLIRKLKIQLKDSSEWDTFLNHFEEMNPSLLMSLQNTHPNLTANDIQLISCIYLDLDTKKIAYLLHVSVETCRKKKERLAAKIGIKVSELRDYFKNIEKNFISHNPPV